MSFQLRLRLRPLLRLPLACTSYFLFHLSHDELVLFVAPGYPTGDGRGLFAARSSAGPVVLTAADPYNTYYPQGVSSAESYLGIQPDGSAPAPLYRSLEEAYAKKQKAEGMRDQSTTLNDYYYLSGYIGASTWKQAATSQVALRGSLAAGKALLSFSRAVLCRSGTGGALTGGAGPLIGRRYGPTGSRRAGAGAARASRIAAGRE